MRLGMCSCGQAHHIAANAMSHGPHSVCTHAGAPTVAQIRLAVFSPIPFTAT